MSVSVIINYTLIVRRQASIPVYRWQQIRMRHGQFGEGFIESLTNFSIQKTIKIAVK